MVHVKESDEFLEDWVEEKLDEGIDPQRLKKILRERDRDPEVVDEVASPFEKNEETGQEEDIEEENNEEEEPEDDSGGFVSRFL